MLASSRICGFVQTRDAGKAKHFYKEVLGLTFVKENDYVALFRGNDTTIVVQKVDEFAPASATVLGWEVQDIEQIVSFLSKRGVVFERYAWMEQDAMGVWKTPDGGKVAWFKDPDGNILSVAQE